MDTTATHANSQPAGQSPLTPRSPGEIPNYRMLYHIGAGGFGDVWLARERVTDVPRAVKTIFKDHSGRDEKEIAGVRRYQNCAHNHPHLLQILSVGENARCYYCVMETADDAESSTTPERAYRPMTLRTLATRRGRLPARETLDIIAKLASALGRLHDQGLAHFDIKPENILIVGGEPKIADVGLVSPLSDASTHAGTRAYMPPDGRPDDLYALGKILYELLTGRQATDFPSLPADFLRSGDRLLRSAVALANRACHPDSTRRYASVTQLRNDLRRLLRARHGPIGWWRRRSRRTRAMLVSGCALVTTVIGITAFAVYRRTVPLELRAQRIDTPFSAEGIIFVPDADQEMQAMLTDARGELSTRIDPGAYALPLAKHTQYFSLEARLRFHRPWGFVQLGLAGDAAGANAIAVSLEGQPGGEGLRTRLIAAGAVGSEVAESAWIIGHPLPGVEYVLRLARCRNEYELALWPLACDDPTPLKCRTAVLPTHGAATHLRITARSPDPLAGVELLKIRLASYTAPLPNASDPLPEAVLDGPVWPTVPPVQADFVWPVCNLIRTPLHPVGSDAWSAIGNWGWWDAGVHRRGDPGELHCRPWSDERRNDIVREGLGPLADCYQGIQLLRFDRAEIGDCAVRVNIRMRGEDQPGNDQAFATKSHGGAVGVVLRLQDHPPDDCAWGAAYVAALQVEPAEHVAAVATRNAGYQLRRTPFGHSGDSNGLLLVRGVEAPQDPDRPRCVTPHMSDAQAARVRAALFSPEGVDLDVTLVGGDLTLRLMGDENPLVEMRDPDPLGRGRIALFCARLLTEFTEVEVTPRD